MNKKAKDFGYYFEKFRAFLLVFLIVLCVIQVGILWSSQSGSFPFLSSFFSDSRGFSQDSIEKVKSNYMLPYKLVVSKGYDFDHIIVPNGSNQYADLWDGAKRYLSAILGIKPTKVEPLSDDKWGLIVAGSPNSYYFEFKTEINTEIVKWVLDSKESADTLSGFDKLVICPEDPNNNYADVVYIRDNSNIYTYVLTDFKGGELNQEVFDSMYKSLMENPNKANYKIAIETGSKTTLPKDLIAPLSSNSTEVYAGLINTPLMGAQGHTSSVGDYDPIQMELFGEVRKDYYPDEDVYGSVVFKKSDIVYRLYNNSVIEYKYTGNQGTSEKGKLLEAYQNAVGFIMDIKARNGYMDNINVYLSSIIYNKNSYTFNFDYNVIQDKGHGEVPLLLKEFKMPNTLRNLENALSVEANSKKVLQSKWLALKLKFEKNSKEYKWNFPEYVDRAYNNIGGLKASNLPIEGYGIYYVITPQKANGRAIYPSFVLFNNSGSYDIPLGK